MDKKVAIYIHSKYIKIRNDYSKIHRDIAEYSESSGEGLYLFMSIVFVDFYSLFSPISCEDERITVCELSSQLICGHGLDGGFVRSKLSNSCREMTLVFSMLCPFLSEVFKRYTFWPSVMIDFPQADWSGISRFEVTIVQSTNIKE